MDLSKIGIFEGDAYSYTNRTKAWIEPATEQQEESRHGVSEYGGLHKSRLVFEAVKGRNGRFYDKYTELNIALQTGSTDFETIRKFDVEVTWNGKWDHRPSRTVKAEGTRRLKILVEGGDEIDGLLHHLEFLVDELKAWKASMPAA